MIESNFLNRRAQIAPALLEALIVAARNGISSYKILLNDQLAPNRVVPTSSQVCIDAPGSDIRHWTLCLTALCPPSNASQFAAETMSPDMRDRNEHPPQKIGQQWMGLLTSQPGWEGVRSEAIDRREMYTRFPRYHARIRTSSTEPYGNLVLALNPSRSHALTSLPGIFDPQVFSSMSALGHSDRVIVMNERSTLLPSVRDHFVRQGLPVVEVNAPVRYIIPALSELWVPDIHDQQEGSPVQKPFVYTENGHDKEFQLKRAWSDGSLWQRLELSQFGTAAQEDEAGLLLIGKYESTFDAPDCLFVNGVSGARFGF